MRDLTDILNDINSANDKYRTLKLSFVIEQSDILRTLSCCYTDLIDHKRQAREDWLSIYNSTSGTNAFKEREADTVVKEYDLIKDIMKSVSMQIDSIRSTISANK